jgi:hypothetical protein
MPAVNDVGEPCAGEPLARFEAAGGGNAPMRPSTCIQHGVRPGLVVHDGPGEQVSASRQRASARPYVSGPWWCWSCNEKPPELG